MSGFVDLQVNGYAGVDFNSEDLTQADVVNVCERLAADGVEQILATIITAPHSQMCSRIARIANWIDTIPEVRQRIPGLHIEGPFISPVDGFVGAHPMDAVQPATVEVAQQFLDAGNGHVQLLTLAPECDADARVTRFLSEQGVVVAGGHSDTSIAQLDRCIDAGLRMFTHLGNGCPGTMHRHDNIIQRVLSRSERLMISFVADGHHVPTFALKNYLNCMPSENVIIVSDAITAAGLGPGQYKLSGQTVYVDDDYAAWAECRTHFAGCATTLPRMQEILVSELDASDAQIEAWMKSNPKRLLR
ncbi:N-acetylglucosamine-6-phosphate deacetylase [Novipirellula galeiformis]|uniref:N-acetylglucosamine-6-phosphate deacetylase n=1 Tax=Novipirellula galeiformis TaxID=2528004 RepID=A0A5C6CP09_9BACT|nr:N-acetylglucosamine-6-phosphate deacetylase [Novipirellula galeiformis]TWU26182.1 N-acetylglucosamine-6-phosphate deacetylase [Novipirellula galeiformis]